MKNQYQNIFFMRLILFFTVVLLVSFSAVLVYNNQYIDQKGLHQMDAESLLVVMEAQTFLEEKLNAVKRMIAMLYNAGAYQLIPVTMANPQSALSPQEILYASAVQEYLQMGFAADPDIISIGLLSKASNKIMVLANGVTKPGAHQAQFMHNVSKYEAALSEYGPNLIPAFEENSYGNNRFILPTLSKIKSVGMADTVGYLSADFSVSRMDAQIADRHQSYPDGRLYITAADGTVLYDSLRESVGDVLNLAQYTDKPTPYFSSAHSETYVRSSYHAKLELYFITTASMRGIRAELFAQKAPLLLLIVVVVVLGILATFLYVKKYSHRISVLTNAMGAVCSGTLSTRIPPDFRNDEISMLSENFNKMCDMLEVYIEEVYISEIQSKKSELARLDAELKQHNAKLYALKTQINPHFLYNSLESIRMRALSKGEREIAQMANILSELFRGSLKSDFVVTVAEEMENCRLFSRFAALRFPHGLSIQFDAKQECLALATASQILQPLVENCINHGIRQEDDLHEISICARIEQNEADQILVLQVLDNGRGIAPPMLAQLQSILAEKQDLPARNIGLTNVNQRIQMLFGESWGVSLQSEVNVGTSVTIRMPAVNRKEVTTDVSSTPCGR